MEERETYEATYTVDLNVTLETLEAFETTLTELGYECHARPHPRQGIMATSNRGQWAKFPILGVYALGKLAGGLVYQSIGYEVLDDKLRDVKLAVSAHQVGNLHFLDSKEWNDIKEKAKEELADYL